MAASSFLANVVAPIDRLQDAILSGDVAAVEGLLLTAKGGWGTASTVSIDSILNVSVVGPPAVTNYARNPSYAPLAVLPRGSTVAGALTHPMTPIRLVIAADGPLELFASLLKLGADIHLKPPPTAAPSSRHYNGRQGGGNDSHHARNNTIVHWAALSSNPQKWVRAVVDALRGGDHLLLVPPLDLSPSNLPAPPSSLPPAAYTHSVGPHVADYPAMLFAAQMGYVKGVEALAACGAAVDACVYHDATPGIGDNNQGDAEVDGEGKTRKVGPLRTCSLDMALQSGHTDMIKVLCSLGADPNLQRSFGTFLGQAVRSMPAAVPALIEAGAVLRPLATVTAAATNGATSHDDADDDDDASGDDNDVTEDASGAADGSAPRKAAVYVDELPGEQTYLDVLLSSGRRNPLRLAALDSFLANGCAAICSPDGRSLLRRTGYGGSTDDYDRGDGSDDEVDDGDEDDCFLEYGAEGEGVLPEPNLDAIVIPKIDLRTDVTPAFQRLVDAGFDCGDCLLDTPLGDVKLFVAALCEFSIPAVLDYRHPKTGHNVLHALASRYAGVMEHSDMIRKSHKMRLMVILFKFCGGAEALRPLINAVDNEGNTPLFCCAAHARDPVDAQMFDYLLANGADLMAVNPLDGSTILHRACGMGCVMPVLERIVADSRVGTDLLNAKDTASGATALHMAAKAVGRDREIDRRSFADQVEGRFLVRLLELGADPNIPNANGETPLMVLAGESDGRDCEAMDALLRYGKCSDDGDDARGSITVGGVAVKVEVPVDINASDAAGVTVAHSVICRLSYFESERVAQFMRAGARFNANFTVTGGMAPFHMCFLPDKFRWLRLCDFERLLGDNGTPEANANLRTLPASAATTGNGRLTLDGGDSAYAPSLLLLADDYDYYVGRMVSVFSLRLIANNCFVYLQGLSTNPRMRCSAQREVIGNVTPLQLAVVSNSPGGGHIPTAKCVRLLLDNGAAVNAMNDFGATALHHLCALEEADVEVAKLLIAAGADVRIRDQRGNTSLHYAAAAHHIAIVKVILEQQQRDMSSNSSWIGGVAGGGGGSGATDISTVADLCGAANRHGHTPIMALVASILPRATDVRRRIASDDYSAEFCAGELDRTVGTCVDMVDLIARMVVAESVGSTAHGIVKSGSDAAAAPLLRVMGAQEHVTGLTALHMLLDVGGGWDDRHTGRLARAIFKAAGDNGALLAIADAKGKVVPPLPLLVGSAATVPSSGKLFAFGPVSTAVLGGGFGPPKCSSVLPPPTASTTTQPQFAFSFGQAAATTVAATPTAAAVAGIDNTAPSSASLPNGTAGSSPQEAAIVSTALNAPQPLQFGFSFNSPVVSQPVAPPEPLNFAFAFGQTAATTAPFGGGQLLPAVSAPTPGADPMPPPAAAATEAQPRSFAFAFGQALPPAASAPADEAQHVQGPPSFNFRF